MADIDEGETGSILIPDNGGVVVKGFNSPGYIHNTNDFPVRVRKVNINYVGSGEITAWVKKIEPGEKFKQYICIDGDFGDGFYIYDMNGVLIGFIVPTKQK